MNRVVRILMKRDGMTKDEAVTLVDETREEILMNQDESDEIIMNNLGLEPDYIFDIL